MRACRCSFDDAGCLLIQSEFDRNKTLLLSVVYQRLLQHRQECGSDIFVNQTNLLRVAYRRSAGFGIDDDPQRLLQVGRVIHVNMADSGSRLNAWNGGVLDAGLYQPGTSPRDQKIHEAGRAHQLVGTFPCGVLQQIDDLRTASCFFNSFF